MLLAISRWRSERRLSAWPWKSRLSVSLWIMCLPRARGPRIRCEGIVLTDLRNISGNKRGIGRHFAASDLRRPSYSGDMDILGKLSAGLARCATVALLL